MAFLNNFGRRQIVIGWPQIMHTKFEDEKGFIEDWKVRTKTGLILESTTEYSLLLQDLPTI